MKKDLFIVLLFFSVFSCATPRHLMIPEAPPLNRGEKGQYNEVDLVLTKFQVLGLTAEDYKNDPEAQLDLLCSRFLEYLEAQNKFHSVINATKRSEPLKNQQYLQMEVQINASHSEFRTFILDVLLFYPFCGYFPLTPLWGDAIINIDANFYDQTGKPMTTMSKQNKSSYGALFYTYYFKDYLNEAMRRAFALAFVDVAKSLKEEDKTFIAAIKNVANTSPTLARITAFDETASTSTESNQRKPILTVLDFQIKNLSKEDAFLIVDLFSSVLIQTNHYRVIDRSQRETLLKEIETSQAECFDEKCQLQIGRLLSADKIVMGSLGVVQSSYILNVKLVDVATGETVSSAYKIFKSLEELLNGCPEIAAKL